MEGDVEDRVFPEIAGLHYIRVLERLHQRLQPEWYLEVGTFQGRSLALCNGNAIAVDPIFRLKDPAIGKQARQRHFFQMTSDDFFATRFIQNSGISIDFAFLDGLHHFEVLLSDFIETERLMSPEGVIALHDCCPLNVEMTARKRIRGFWTGDVWKTIAILRKYRPDLTIDVTTARPTGLAIISGLDPKSNVLSECYDDAVAEFQSVPMSEEALTDYYDGLELNRPIKSLAKLPDRGSPQAA
ncbi:MAG: class I SAM-dependent methyltransferase [Pseudomonadota bacterium]